MIINNFIIKYDYKTDIDSDTQTCKTEEPPLMVRWWKDCRASIRWEGPTAHPVFHPVTLNVFPALPMLMVLSAIPSKVASVN